MRRLCVLLGVLILGLAGCEWSGDPAGTAGSSASKAPPPRLAGKVLVMASPGNKLKLLSQEADGHLSVAPLDLPKLEEFELAADRRTLVYRVGPVVTVRDLAGGGERQLAGDAKTDSYCLRISPDSRHVLYRRADDLVVVDLTGKMTVLDAVRQEKYGLGTMPVTATSELKCGEWLDATHVAFDRRPKMPESIEVSLLANSAVVEADTTTVAVLGGPSPKLLDSVGRWHPTATCGDWVATNDGSSKGVLHLKQRTGDADVTKAGAFIGAELAVPGSEGGNHGALFVPGSCRALLYTVDQRTFRAIDPATRAVAATPVATLPSGGIEVRLFDEPAAWQPAQGAEVLAVVVDKQLVLVDIKAGTATPVPAAGLDASARVVAWLPP
jgi:hypothetical protein